MSSTTPVTREPDPPAIGTTAAERWRSWLTPAIALAVFAIAAAGIHAELKDFSYATLRQALHALGWTQIGLAFASTAASFLLLTGYDWSALKYIGKRLPYPAVALTSFCGYAIANMAGVGAITGGSVRYRMYLDEGLDGADVARVITFCVLAFAIGVHAVGALAILVHPEEVSQVTHLGADALRAIAAAACLVIGITLGACFRHRGPIALGPWKIRLPNGWLAVGQLVISALDILFSGLVLYVLLPPNDVPFLAFLALYASAAVAGLVSHIPGGIGVFEAVMLVALRDNMPIAGLGAALAAYRAIYYLVPFVLATLALALREAGPGIERIATRALGVARLGSSLTPFSMSLLTFTSGVVLLWSAATPGLPERLRALHAVVPLFIVETSHLLAGAIGGALLVTAHGLRHKLNGAWAIALAFSILGSAAALTKGVDYEEATLLMIVAVLLVLTRKRFYRHTALINSTLTIGWVFGVMGALLGMYALILFSYKHVAYAHTLWWQFGRQGEASRAMRAGLAGAAGIFVWGLWQLMRPPRRTIAPPAKEELDRAEAIARNQAEVAGLVALLGDKQILFAEDGDGFVSYSVRGTSWVAMGDPVGPPDVINELAWRLRELADTHGGRVAFYQTSATTLPVYIDMGLTPFKLGDEAVVPLTAFSLEGSRRKSLRQSHTRAERDGLSFELIPRADVAAQLPLLEAISKEWLSAKNTREKRFSLGAFTPDYVCRNDVALVRCKGLPVAFATLMTTDRKAEVSVDLMRHTGAAPGSTMEYLFVKLLLHFKAQGYARFMLGMAPLSGLENHPLAPVWHRFGHLIYNRGERFYNFQGLRLFKEKFEPRWEPRYLVTHSGLNPLIVMVDIAALIAGGVGGVFGK